METTKRAMLRCSKEMKEKLFYDDPTELMVDIMKQNGELLKVAIFDGESVKIGGLYTDTLSNVRINRLPRGGYCTSLVDRDMLNQRYGILKKMPIRYEDAVFYRGEVYFLDFETGVIEECQLVAWNDSGYYSQFEIVKKNGEKVKLSASVYETSFVFIEA